MPEKLILLVEDDETLCFLAQKQFKKIGVSCRIAGTGMQAVEMANDEFALILMDLGLPDMDGIEATFRIREEELKGRRKRVPIVALTEYSEREKCLRAGMDDFLLKPVPMERLQEVVRKYCPLDGAQ
jgi:polar amino acid transport system substrate-binding protein